MLTLLTRGVGGNGNADKFINFLETEIISFFGLNFLIEKIVILHIFDVKRVKG